MSAAGSIGGVTSPAASGLGASSRNTQSRFSELSSEEFIELIVTELTNQDPTEPQDTQALLDQIGAIRSIESDTSLIDRLGQLVDQSSFSSAAGLIGAVVRGISRESGAVTGQVLSVSQTTDGAVLNLVGGERVLLDDVIEAGAPVFDAPDADDDGDDDNSAEPPGDPVTDPVVDPATNPAGAATAGVTP